MPYGQAQEQSQGCYEFSWDYNVGKYRNFYAASLPPEPLSKMLQADLIFYEQAKKIYLLSDSNLYKALHRINSAIDNTDKLHDHRLAYYYNLKACIILTIVILDIRNFGHYCKPIGYYRDCVCLGSEINLATAKQCLEKARAVAEQHNNMPWQIYINLARIEKLYNNSYDDLLDLIFKYSKYDFNLSSLGFIMQVIDKNFDVLPEVVLRGQFEPVSKECADVIASRRYKI